MRAYRGNFRPYYEQYKGSTNQKTGDSMVSPEKKLKKFLLILGITGCGIRSVPLSFTPRGSLFMCIWDGAVSAAVSQVLLEPHCGAASGEDALSAGVACRRDRTSGAVMPCFRTPLRGRQHGGEPDGAFYPEISGLAFRP